MEEEKIYTTQNKQQFWVTGSEWQEYIKDTYAEIKRERERLSQEWDTCEAVYQGVTSQLAANTAVDAQAILGLVGKGDDQEILLESTKLVKANLFLHSKLCIADPVVTCKAYNFDVKNRKAASLCQVVIEHIKQATTLQEVLERGPYLNTGTRGSGVVKVGWNPDKGVLVDGPNEQEPDKPTRCEGGWEVTPVVLKAIGFDPQSPTLEESEVAIEEIVMSYHKAVHTFGKEHAEALKTWMQTAENIKRLEDFGYRDLKPESVRTLVVCELWQPGRPWNGMLGRRCRFINPDQAHILQDGEHPYEHKRLPYLMLTDIDIDNSKWGMSRNVIAYPLQEALNQFRTQVMANVELHGNIKIMKPEGAINDDSDDNHPGSELTFNPALGAKPEYLKPTTVTSDIWRLEEALTKEIDALFGMGEFSQGQIPRELSSYAVQLAIEADDKYRIRLFNKKKLFIKRLYEMLIELTKQFVKEPRMLRIVGSELHDQEPYFQGKELVGEYGIYCDFGAYLPIDPGARKQQILELVKSGAFEKAGGNFKKLISILVDGDMLDVYDMFNNARRRQDGEIVRLIDGEDVPVEDWQEHNSHMEALIDFMQTAFFENLPPETKKRIWSHYEEHEKRVAKQAADAAQQQQAGGGQPQDPAAAAPADPAAQLQPAG